MDFAHAHVDDGIGEGGYKIVIIKDIDAREEFFLTREEGIHESVFKIVAHWRADVNDSDLPSMSVELSLDDVVEAVFLSYA